MQFIRNLAGAPACGGVMRRHGLLTAPLAALLVAGCSYNISAIGVAGDRAASVSAGSGGVVASQSGPSGVSTYVAPARPGARDLGPVLLADGTCSAPYAGPPPAQVGLGLSECALVAARGRPADVLIGESGRGQREVQVLYQEPGGKKIYLFSDNTLIRIVE